MIEQVFVVPRTLGGGRLEDLCRENLVVLDAIRSRKLHEYRHRRGRPP